MDGKMYPDLQKICRLCLKENEGTVCIFPKDKSSSLSIPRRIMICAALEVQESDDFPKKICPDCRLQLEKFYYFRKMSQASDIKLRKHLRLISVGQVSNVFTKKLLEDDYYEKELELEESLKFIEEQEDKRKQEENRKFEEKLNDIKHQLELEIAKDTIKAKYREEIEYDLRVEVQNKVEDNLRKDLMDQCLNKAKELVTNEVREECRQSEIKSLLENLQTYLTKRQQTVVESPIKISNISSIVTDINHSQTIRTAPNLEYVEMEQQYLSKRKKDTSNYNVTEEELIIKNEESHIDGNSLTYVTDEAFVDVQKKMPDNDEFEYGDDEMKNNAKVIENNENSQGTTETSYRRKMSIMPEETLPNDNECIISMLEKITSNQGMMLQKMTNVENELQKLKADQTQTIKNIKQLVKKNVHVGTDTDFPILSIEDMSKLNNLILTDPDTYIAKIKTILRTGGIEKNFDRILHSNVYLSMNYDGINGKKGLKEFKALHDAIFEAVKEDGLTVDLFKKNIQLCFKTFKNRYFAKKCRDKKKEST